MLYPNILFKTLTTTCLLTLLWVAAPAFAAKLAPETQEITVGDQVIIHVEQARTSASVKWRSSTELELDSSKPGQGLFRAVAPGRALVTATVDGELASTFIQINPGAGAPPATAGTAEPVTVETPKLRSVTAAAPGTVSQPPKLRELLPENAFAYLRIPSPWGLLGAPKGNLYAQAVGSAAYADAVDNLRSGFVENLLPEIPPEGQLILQLLLDQIRSPLEIAVMPPAKAEATMPDLVLTAALNADSPEAANALLTGIAEQGPGLELKIPMAADSAGMLLVEGMPLQTYFSTDDSRLYISFGDPGASPDPLNQWVAARQPISEHPMYAAEQAIDASGQGLFAWVDPAPLMQTMEKLGQAEEVAGLRAFGAGEAKSLAFGLGSSNGKQRLKLLLDMPQVGFRSFVPAVDTKLTLQTAGEPEMAVMLGLPGPEDLAQIENNLLGMLPPEEIQAYQAGKEEFQTKLGFSVEQMLGAFGDELLVILDQSGYYVALRLRDPALYEEILAQLLERFSPPYETRELLGHTYHHLTLPSLMESDPELSAAMQESDPLSRRLSSLPSHLYWTREGDYLLFATVPQTLMDYRYIDQRVSLADWLRQSQGMDPSGALLLGSTRSPGTPRLMYDINLWTLETLGDLMGRPVDLFALPTPRELDLPASGAVGLQIASSPTQMAVELVYESNPLELLMATGGFSSLTSAGILAAIALPAYADYENQAQVAGELAQASQLRQEVLMFYIEQGRFPNADEADNLLSTFPSSDTMYLSLEPDTGVISAEIYGADLNGQNLLMLTPEIGDGGNIIWNCAGSTLSAEHLNRAMLCN